LELLYLRKITLKNANCVSRGWWNMTTEWFCLCLCPLLLSYPVSNQISGTIPSEIGLLPSLKFLFLYGNQISGTIPSEIGMMTSLTDLLLSDNQISGTIPSEIGLLASLEQLDLGKITLKA